MNVVTITSRELLGKKSKRLLAEGMIPAVMYNSTGKSDVIAVDKSEMERLLLHLTTTTILTLKDTDKEYKALVKEIDRDPITDTMRHISFFEIDENAEMTFSIPIHVIGVSPAVKNNLGVLVQPTKSIDVRCMLKNLQDFIEIDISNLRNPGESVILRDIKLPDGMHLPSEDFLDTALVTISQLQKLTVIEDEEVVGEGEEGAEEGEEAEEEKTK